MKKALLVCFCLTALISCSPKKGKLDPGVQDFLKVFKERISQSDEEALKMFSSDQDKDVILKAIQILRNKDLVVRLNILYEDTKSYEEDYFTALDIPIDVSASGRPEERTFISLKLLKREGNYLVISLDGERLYRTYSALKDETENAESIAEFVAQRKPYYDRAKEIQKNYDSVIWYVNHDTATYFYAVNGKYNFDSLKKGSFLNYKMGLVDKRGKVIVPVEFDLVFNPSSTLSNAVEVMKNGKIGFYSVDGKEIVPAVYDWLIPFKDGECIGLVMKDSVNGWLDKEYKLHNDFPSKAAERAVNEFEYLTGNKFLYDKEQKEIINMLSPADRYYSGTGIIIAPTYIFKIGLLPQITDNFLTLRSNKLYQYGNDMMEARVEKPGPFVDILNGFVADIQRRFVGGRGEFYSNQKIVLVNKKRNIVGAIDLSGAMELQIKKMNDTLFQYSYKINDFFDGPGDDFPEINYPMFGYFSFDERKINSFTSARRFGFTKLFKLDSTYITGDFKVWDSNAEKEFSTQFLSKEALRHMRDEILAEYGFRFNDIQTKYWLNGAPWYKPTTDSYDEVYAMASDIDKHNLDFLAKLIGPYNSKPA